MAGFGDLVEKKGKQQLMDGVDDATIIIDLAHHKVHEGQHFTFTDYDADVDSGLANRKVWQITAPNSAKRFHTILSFFTSNAGLFEFNENPTLNVEGTALTAYNNDRNSASVTTLVMKYDTTLLADGTSLTIVQIGANTPKTQVGGVGRSSIEWILKANEDYAIIFQADNDNTVVSIVVEFYEV